MRAGGTVVLVAMGAPEIPLPIPVIQNRDRAQVDRQPSGGMTVSSPTSPSLVEPVHLSGNQPADRFYRGGARIRDFRGETGSGDREPEDWIASTTTLHGQAAAGLTRLPGGALLIDEIRERPLLWLGAEHVERYGVDTKLLIKLLDAGQRLPVHIHPDGAFARERLGAQHGKAEAWCILAGGPVHLGFRRDVSREELADWTSTQNTAALLEAMHLIELSAGDTVYVPPGLPHAIGAGVFLLEVQEPEDLSILLEWEGFALDGPRDGHLGIGFPSALEATDRSGWSRDRIASLVVSGGQGEGTLAAAAADYFRAERRDIDGAQELAAGFGTLVILEGSGSLASASGARVPLRAGDTVLVPYAAGAVRIEGSLSLIHCRPPQPTGTVARAD